MKKAHEIICKKKKTFKNVKRRNWGCSKKYRNK